MGQLGHIMGAGCGGGPQPGERRCRGEGRWRGCERADGASDGEQSWGVCVTDFTRKRLYLVTVLRKLTSVYFFRAKRPFSSGAWTGWYDDARAD